MLRVLTLCLFSLCLAACEPEPKALELQGYLEGEFLRMAAPDGGWITALPAVKGQRVHAGDLLFVLDAARERALRAEAQAQLAKAISDLADLRLGSRPEEIAAIEAQVVDADAAQRLAALTLDRQTALAASHVAAQSKLDEARAASQQAAAQAARVRAQLATARLASRPDRIKSGEAQVEAARHALEEAEWRLAQREARAPVDALVDEVPRRTGEWAPAGGVIASLLPDDGTKAVFFAPAAIRAGLRQGGSVAVACVGCPANLVAKIDRIASEAEYAPPVIYSRETTAKLLFRVEATLPPRPAGASTEAPPAPGQPVTVRPLP